MPPSLHTSSAVRSLYRSLLREVNRLPYGYLRVFFRLKFRDDICSDLKANSRINELSTSKRRRLERELRRLESANSGNKKAVSRMLDLAYGRKGKLKRELVESFLSSAGTEKPDPIIKGVESSRPPAYSPELVALLTSPTSRTGKPLTEAQIRSPPTLPPRADPNSKEAQLLGPFSKRREVNIHWRFFANQKQRIIPPLEVDLRQEKQPNLSDADGVEVSESSRKSDIPAMGLSEGGFQGVGLLKEIQRLAGVKDKYRTPTGREQRPSMTGGLNSEATFGGAAKNTTLPTKFLRRRHKELLRKIPVLTWSEHSPSDQPGGSRGKYEVSLPSGALVPPSVPSAKSLPVAGECTMTWIRRAQEMDKQKNVPKRT